MSTTLRDMAIAEMAKVRSAPGGEVPEETVSLPSKGKVYPVDDPLHMAESIEIRSMNAKDEEILSSPALLKKGVALSAMMKRCITNKLVDPDKMLVGDRNAVLIAIRNASYGTSYEVEMTCPSCGAKLEHAFDMSRLPMKVLTEEPIEPGANAFRFQLPRSKREVIFKLMTGQDVTELDRTMTQIKKARKPGDADGSLTHEMHQQIVSIAGETDRNKLLKMVDELSAMDSLAFRKKVMSVVPGIDMVQNMVCTACDVEQEVDVPLGTEFFWPSVG